MPRASLVVVFGILGVLAACGEKSAPLPPDDALADLARPTLDGTTFPVASLEGKVVVVNFWSPG